jgi:hypothetical protein
VTSARSETIVDVLMGDHRVIAELIAQMSERGVVCSDLRRERWGLITHLTLPGGGAVGVCKPTHLSPLNPS